MVSTLMRNRKGWLTLLFTLLMTAAVWAQPPQPPPPDDPLISDQMSQALRSGRVTLNYENVDIRLLGRLMAELTGRNIIFDQSVQGKITVASSQPVSTDEAWQVFRLALERYNFGVVESNGVTQVLPLKDIRKYAPVIKNPGPVRSNMSVGVLIFQHADVNLMQNALRPLLSDIGELQPYVPSKAIVVADRGPIVERIAATARHLDQAHDAELVSVIFPTYAEATEIAPILEELVNPQGVPADQRTQVKAFQPSNAVLIYGRPEKVRQVKGMLSRVDVPSAAPEDVQEPRFYVIPLQNANAEELARILSEMLAEKSDLQQERLERNPQLAREARARQGRDQPADASTAPSGQGDGATPGANLPFLSSVVSADVETNSLVFYISPSQYVEVEQLVMKLDAPRKQVLVTAVVAEVTLGRLLEKGARFQALTAGGVLSTFNAGVTEEGLLSFLASGNFLVGAAGSGTRNIDINGRQVAVPELFGFITAQRSSSDFNLISAPRILTEDHKQAEINVGNVVPFPTGAQFNAFGQPTVTYDYRDVGIKMLVTPHVSQSDMIKLEIEQEVQEVTDFLEQNLGGTGFTVPLISSRRVNTTITVKDGQTLMIGGLISKSTIETMRKVPILGDIPLIQALFREMRKEESKTTLFISLTPHIVASPDAIERIDQPYREFLEGYQTPSDHETERRPRRSPAPSPYHRSEGESGEVKTSEASRPADATVASTVAVAPQTRSGIHLEGFRLLEEPRTNGTSRASVRLTNGERQGKELVVLGTVRQPDGTRRELRAESVHLAPGVEREVLLPPTAFNAGPGVYEFDLAVWEGDRIWGRLSLPERVEVR